MGEKLPTSPERKPNAPSRMAALGDALAGGVVEGAERGKGVADVVNGAMKDNTVSPDKLAGALKDGNLAERFEAVALFLVKLFGGDEKSEIPEAIGKFMATWKEFFHTVEDSNEGDEKGTPKLAVAKEGEVANPSRARIVAQAVAAVGSTGFRGAEVDGGNLACAQVATTILVRAGLLDSPNLGIGATAKILEKRGWEKHGPGYTPRPGDVIIWNRATKRTPDGAVALGYPHIGVVIDELRCVSNSSRERMPRVHGMGRTKEDNPFWYQRGIDCFYSPPLVEAAVA